MHSTRSDFENLQSLLGITDIISDSTIRTHLSCWCSCLLLKVRGNARGCAHGRRGNGRVRGCGCARGENGCDRASDNLPEMPHGSARG